MSFHTFSSFLTSAIVPIQGAFVLWKNPRNPANRTWCILSVCVGLWSLGYTLTIASSEYNSSLQWARFSEANACIIPAIFLHFTFRLLRKEIRPALLQANYAIAVMLAFLALRTPLIIDTVRPTLSFPYFSHFGSLAWFYVTFFFANVILAHIELLGGMSHVEKPEKTRLLYVFITGLMGFGTATPGFFLSYDVPIPAVSNLVFLYTIPIAYAIVKHQLMDITVVIRKTAVYSALVAAITLIYLLIVLTTERLFQVMLGYHSLPTSILAAAIIALIFQPLRSKIQAFVDQHLFKGSVPQLAEQATHLRQELARTDQLRAVGTFAAGMAHEIKNPLATIKTFVEHLPIRYDNPEFRRNCSRLVGQEVAKIDRLVQEVLEFARPSPPQRQSVTLSKLCDNVLELFQTQILQQRITVQRTYTDTGCCEADPHQLTQALHNLFLNSLDAMPHGGTLAITIARHGRWLSLTIRDTGCGIPPEILRRIAEPFVTSKSGGNGLGLAIVQTIIQSHGGRVEIQSPKDGGTTVSVWLPGRSTRISGGQSRESA